MSQVFFSQLWVQKLGWTLLHFLWQGTVVALIYAIVRGILGRSLSAQGRYALACLAMTAMVLAPPLTFLLIPHGGDPGLPTILWSLSASAWQRFLPGFVAVWAAGVLVFSLRLVGGWRLIRHLRSASYPAPSDWQRTLADIAAKVKTSRPVRLTISSLVEVPTVIGWLRPVILVPVGTLTGLPLEHVIALLAHELAHIRRSDYVASILQNIAEAVLFYHPAVWWISEQIRAERELCCDDLAVAASGDVLTYAYALARLESIQPARIGSALAANGGSLVNRIRRLIEPDRATPENLPGPGAAWAMTLLWMAGVGIATVHAAQTPASVVRVALPAIARAEVSFQTVDESTKEIANPVQELASHARETLLFDPFLDASTMQSAVTQPLVVVGHAESVPPVPASHDEHLLVAKTQAEPTILPTSLPTPQAPRPVRQDQVIHSTTHLVQVEVVVRDNHGPVEGLTQSDFELFDNGAAQPIGAFSVSTSKAAPSPATTVLLIDRLGTSFEYDSVARQRIAEVLKSMPSGEPVAVYILDGEFRRISDFTDDPVRRARSVAEAWEAHSPAPQSDPTKLRALEAIANRLNGVPGRKNLIWIANSFPVPVEAETPQAYAQMMQALRQLNAANVAVFPTAVEGMHGIGAPRAFPAPAPNSPLLPAVFNSTTLWPGLNLTHWAEKTGGVAAFNIDIATAIERAFNDAKVTCTLGFYPSSMDGKYHELKVKVARKNVEVRNRQGYLAAPAPDLATGKITGQSLEARAAANPDTATLNIAMQLHYLHTAPNRATVQVALDVVPTGMTFQRTRTGFHSQIDVVGIAMRPDGSEAARLADTVDIDVADQQGADTFVRSPWHYEHSFAMAAGAYVYQIVIGAGPNMFGRKEVALNVEPSAFSRLDMGGIALSVKAIPVDPATTAGGPAPQGLLVAGGKEFLPAATNRFRKSDQVYFYTEIYEPGLAATSNAPSLAMEYRVVERATGKVKQDSGVAGVNGYIRPGDPLVPFATKLPVAKLAPGSYRLEVLAGHTSGPEVVGRSVDFDVN